MFIKDPINITCRKNGKDLSNGAPKNKIWNYTNYPVFANNFRNPWMKLNFFFANFQILGTLGCQGWVVIPQNVKKSEITAPYWLCLQSILGERKEDEGKSEKDGKRDREMSGRGGGAVDLCLGSATCLALVLGLNKCIPKCTRQPPRHTRAKGTV